MDQAEYFAAPNSKYRALCLARAERCARRLGKAHREAWELAKERGYLVTRPRREDALLREAYWFWNEGKDLPEIRVTIRREYAAVSMDLIATSYRLSAEGVDAISRALLQYGDPRGYPWGYGHTYSHHPKVAIAKAEDLAAEFLRIAKEYRADLAPAVYD